jgi:hypothetical protein
MLMPWRGMFEQIRLCDTFIFYDDVQLPLGGGKGRGFITRVQIKSQEGFRWLSLPVKRSHHGKQLIAEAAFAHQNWRQQHLESIRQCYSQAPFFERTYELVIRPIYQFQTDSVSEFCMNSTTLLAKELGLNRDWQVSSRVDRPYHYDASERVLELCRQFGAARYITGHGAMNYINYDLFERAGVSVEYIQYRLTPYPQLHGSFNPYVSVIDLLFNVGMDAAEYLNSEPLYWKEYMSSILDKTEASNG